MIRSTVSIGFLNLALTLAAAIAPDSAAMAQTNNPALNDLLNQTNQIIDESWDLIHQVEAQQQQQEQELSYSCYTLGDQQSCLELQAFYQRRIRGYDAGIQYWQNLQNSGWADSFGY